MTKTLLLADDSVTIQKVVSISFASEDVKLVTVDNGDDAVEQAKAIRPDLILADVVMPGLSGYEVCEAVKSDPDLRHIPVLLLSGTFEAFDEERAARAGAAGHIAKPFEAQNLVAEVKRLLARAPAPKTAPAAIPIAAPEPMTVDAPGAESFDFFDDDFSDLDAPVASDERDGNRLDESAAAFVLADDDFTPAVSPAAQPRSDDPGPDAAAFSAGDMYPDRTLAILPDDVGTPPPTAVSGEFDVIGLQDERDELLTTAEDESEDSFLTADPASTADEAFAFSFESESTAPESIAAARGGRGGDARATELVEETVLDPIAASDSDFVAPDMADAFFDDSATVLEDAGSATRLLGADEIPEPPGSAAVFEIEEGLDPVAPEPVTLAPEPRSTLRAGAVLAEITPGLEKTMHDTLEKMAWEAFGEATDKIVREVVDRIEKIAWEVVPQLTETLVKAEIRRLKGEDAD